MSIVLDRERTREARRERWLEQGLGQYETELRARKKCADERKAQEQKTEEEGRPEWNGGTSTTDTHRTTSEGRRRRRPSSPVATRLVSGALARGATKIVAREIVRQSLADVDAEERAKPLYRLLSQLAKSSHGEDSKDDDNSHHLDALAAGIDLLDNFDLIDAENCLCVPPGRDLAGRGGDANASIAVLAAALSQSGSTIARLEFLPGVAAPFPFGHLHTFVAHARSLDVVGVCVVYSSLLQVLHVGQDLPLSQWPLSHPVQCS